MRRITRGPFTVLLSALLSAAVFLVDGAALSTESSVAATAATRVSAADWLRGWPMDRHDPQRSSLSPGQGPTHPHLAGRFAGLFGKLVAADGSVVGITGRYPHSALAIARPSGRIVTLNTQVAGASALRRNGAILQVGADNSRAEAVSAKGKLLWVRDALGLPKSAQPLVTDNGRFVIAAEGHSQDGSSGLWILGTNGTVASHIARGNPVLDVAVGSDGNVSLLMRDSATGVDFAVGYSPQLQERWRYRLTSSLTDLGPCSCLMAAPNGRVYVADGKTLLALDAQGALEWSYVKPDGLRSMAERADEKVLLAGNQNLTAISARGERLWDADIHPGHHPGPNDYIRAPSLAVDSAATAYVGTSDGKVVVIDPAGAIVARVPAGGYVYGQTPQVMLGPDGMLVAAGADSGLWVYR